MFVEAEVVGAEHFGDVEDLAGVHAEVFDDVVDGVEAGDLVALDLQGGDEIGGGEAVAFFLDFAISLYYSLSGSIFAPIS